MVLYLSLALSGSNTCIADENLEVLPINNLFYSFLASFRRRREKISMVQSVLINSVLIIFKPRIKNQKRKRKRKNERQITSAKYLT